MKVKVIGNRKPVIDGAKRLHGYVAEVSDEDGQHLLSHGLVEVVETRARKADGTYQGDDPATPENEAYDPPKKPAAKKPAAKKRAAPKGAAK